MSPKPQTRTILYPACSQYWHVATVRQGANPPHIGYLLSSDVHVVVPLQVTQPPSIGACVLLSLLLNSIAGFQDQLSPAKYPVLPSITNSLPETLAKGPLLAPTGYDGGGGLGSLVDKSHPSLPQTKLKHSTTANNTRTHMARQQERQAEGYSTCKTRNEQWNGMPSPTREQVMAAVASYYMFCMRGHITTERLGCLTPGETKCRLSEESRASVSGG